MKNASYDYNLFSGLVFWGSEYLPGDITLSINSIRKWAVEQKLIWDVEDQLIASERIEELSKHFLSEDKLSILIHLYKDPSGNLNYAEYPYLSIRSLIKKGKNIKIVYWEIIPSVWSADGRIKEYGEVHFGFWYPGIGGDEFCSVSNAKLVVRKFYELYHELSNNYDKKILNNGVLSIEVDGDIKAKFFKTGRLFDVELNIHDSNESSI